MAGESNKWLIVGSTAAYHWFPELRAPKDLDLLSPITIKSADPKICFIDAHWHDAAEYLISINEDPVFADPNVLFTLKVSHAHWNIHWDKTMYDIGQFQRLGCTLNRELYDRLVEVWKHVHGKPRVNLNQPVDMFFKDAVKRIYDHEYLHEQVAFNDRPMHERIRPDLTNAWCSQELFERLTPDEQAQTALEEIMVTAIERSRLDVASQQGQRSIAMFKAFRQLCTSMTTGWFSLFLILNRVNLLSERKTQWQTAMNRSLLKISQDPSPRMAASGKPSSSS